MAKEEFTGDYLDYRSQYLKILNSRRSGRTTRIVDSMVQELFKNGTTEVQDHTWPGWHRIPPQEWVSNALGVLLKRLNFEHEIPKEHLTVKKHLNGITVSIKPDWETLKNHVQHIP